MTTEFLSASVEASRLVSAENYYNQPPFSSPTRLEPSFDLSPSYKVFKVKVDSPSYLPQLLLGYQCEELGLRFVKSIFEYPTGSGNYEVRSKPYASTEQVSEELESIFVPF